MNTADTARIAELEDPGNSALQQALGLQIELTAIVARGGGVDRLLAGWQHRTDEGVAVFDRLGRALGRSRGFPSARLARITEILSTQFPRLGEVLLLPAAALGDDDGPVEVTPFAGNDTVRGYFARQTSQKPLAELAVPALRSLLALEYERHWLMDEPTRRQWDEQLGRVLLLSDEGGGRAMLRGLGIHATQLRALAIEARNETHSQVLVDDLAVMLTTPLIRYRGRIVECLVTADPRQTLAEYGLDVPLGLGTPLAPQHAARTMRQATLALETSRRVGAPIEYRDGAAHDFLIRIASPEYLEAFADATLGPIGRARGGHDLLVTLHTWLTERRSIEATGDRLGVHRHTVRNRIQRIAQLTGHDLDGIDAQTELWLALKARGFQPDERPGEPAAGEAREGSGAPSTSTER
jgi:purine catabolism regulator